MPRGRSQNLSQRDDDEAPLSQSQSQTQRRSQAARLSAEELIQLARRVVRHVLAAHGRGEPLRREAVRRVLEPQHAGCMQLILQQADLQLRDVFGMSLEVLPNKRDLMLVNRLPASEELGDELRQENSELQRRGLLVTILALIFMNNGMVHEETLWNFLAKLGVLKDTQHECFGNVKKLVTEEFKRAGYLKTEEVKMKDQMALQFYWGDGAELAVDKMDLLQFVCSIWGDNPRTGQRSEPRDWPDQYQIALEHQKALEERREKQE